MKRCSFCDHYDRTENGEDVCTKRLICLEDLDSFFPCADFSVTLDKYAHLGACIIVLALALIIATLLW